MFVSVGYVDLFKRGYREEKGGDVQLSEGVWRLLKMMDGGMEWWVFARKRERGRRLILKGRLLLTDAVDGTCRRRLC